MSHRLRSVVLRALPLLALASGCKRDEPDVVAIWPDGAPGSEARRSEPEIAKDWWVENVHDPTLTAFRALHGKSNGAAVVVLPGGGHRQLVFGPEGIAPARFLAERGVTAFVLKYRLARSAGSPYTLEDSKADGLRAVRWIRHHATRYAIDPKRVGVMGWSAGGEIAALLSYGAADGNPSARDPIDRLSGRPDFQIAIYPGPVGVPETLPPDAPPAFFLAAGDDAMAAETLSRLFTLYREAHKPVELHVFAKGGHAFNMGDRSELDAIRRWPERLAEWLQSTELVRR